MPDPVILVHGRPVRYESAYDPDREAERLLDRLPLHAATLVLLFAGSTRAILSRVLDRIRPGTTVLCIDPDHQLHDRLPHNLRTKATFLRLDEPQRVAAAVQHHFYKPRPHPFRHLVVKNPNLVRHFAQDYDRLERHLAPLLHELYRNELILRRFSALWERNIAANTRTARERGRTLNPWRNTHRGRQALILCAGPSLDPLLPNLPALQDRSLLVAVDTALIPLLKAGIRPHIVVTLDGQLDNLRDFDDPIVRRLCTDIPLAIEVSAHHAIPRLYPGPLAFFHTLRLLPDPDTLQPKPFVEPRYKPFLDAFPDAEGLQSGGSVSTTALDLCLLLGCSPIVYAGQDLGFIDYRPYCRGTYLDKLLGRREFRFLTRSNLVLRPLLLSDRPLTHLADGTLYRPSVVMDGYRRWLEDAQRLLQDRLRFLRPGTPSPL